MMSNRQFSLIRKFVNTSDRIRHCILCGNTATKEALFDIGNGMNVIERYCDQCINKVNTAR